MRKEDKEYLDMFATGIRAELKANKDIINLVHKAVLSIDERCTKVEKETSLFRMIQNNPLVSVPILLVSLGVIIALVDLIGIVNLF